MHPCCCYPCCCVAAPADRSDSCFNDARLQEDAVAGMEAPAGSSAPAPAPAPEDGTNLPVIAGSDLLDDYALLANPTVPEGQVVVMFGPDPGGIQT